MKSRSNSSNKNEKHMIEADNVKKINLYPTGNRLRNMFSETELQLDRKTKAQKPKFIFENK